MKIKHMRLTVYLIFFCVMFFIAFQVPYCHDEWQWGLPDRIDLMKKGFENYNGRYLGNILALVITRSVLAKAFILSGGVVWLLYVINGGYAGKRSKNDALSLFLLLFGVILLLAVPKTLFAQSYGWPAAFVNFVPPVILFLIYFNWTGSIYSGGPLCRTQLRTVLAFPLGIATQLFSEHITIFVLLYAAWILLFGWFRHKKLHPLHAVYFLSCAAGAVLMFSNGAYQRAASDAKTYKQIRFGLAGMIQQFFDRILDPLFLDNWILNLLLAAILIWIIVRKGKKNLLSVEMTLVFEGYAAYSIWNRLCPDWKFMGSQTLDNVIRALLAALFFVNVLLCIWLYTDAKEKYEICVLYAAMVCVAVPLLAANPIGPRCFYVSYIFEACVILRLLQIQLAAQQEFFYWITGAAAAAIVLCFVYGRMFAYIGAADRLRGQIIKTSVENQATEITLPLLPYSDYYWTTVPVNEKWEKKFKAFYHIPEDMVLRFE